MKQKFTILFDLDGTLVDTAPDLMLAHNHVMKKFGYPTKSTEDIRNLVGKGAGALIGRSIWGQAKKEYHSVSDLKIKDDASKSFEEEINEMKKKIGNNEVKIDSYAHFIKTLNDAVKKGKGEIFKLKACKTTSKVAEEAIDKISGENLELHKKMRLLNAELMTK